MAAVRKIILVLLDGLGDRSYKVLGGRTPLQAAETSYLDQMAHLGGNGLYHASTPGQCLPSEIAHYLLFGYDLEFFPGRGLLEAVGAGVPFDDDDVLCLAHLAEVTEKAGVPFLRTGRDDLEGDRGELDRLYCSLRSFETQGVSCQLHHVGRNDAILVLRGEVSPHVTDCDPMIAGMAMARVFPREPNPEPGRAARTAHAINAYINHCYHLLNAHEENRLREKRKFRRANFLATHRCGRRIPRLSFSERWGMRGMFIGSGLLYGGLAKELGFTFRNVKDSKDPGEDLRERIALALADDCHEFFHVHTKVPDQAAHSGDPLRKRDAISALDQGLDGLAQAVMERDDLVVAITADHSTPSRSCLIHSGEPVPVAILGPGVRRDGVQVFDEVSAASGCLGFLKGEELILTILNFADRSALFGHRLGRLQKPYLSHTYEPFKITK